MCPLMLLFLMSACLSLVRVEAKHYVVRAHDGFHNIKKDLHWMKIKSLS